MFLGLSLLLWVGRHGTQRTPGLGPVYWCSGWVLSPLGDGLGPGGRSEGPQEARGDRWAGRRYTHTSGQLGTEQEVRPPQNQERQEPEEPGRARTAQPLLPDRRRGRRSATPPPTPTQRILTGSLLSTFTDPPGTSLRESATPI